MEFRDVNQNGIEDRSEGIYMLSREEFTGFLRASHFQYMWRYKNKNGVEDLKKADWYLNKLIHHETNNEEK